jgi:hypothetical protein
VGGGTGGPMWCQKEALCDNPFEPCGGPALCRRVGGPCNPPGDSFARTWYTHEICQRTATATKCNQVVTVNVLCRQIYECICKVDIQGRFLCGRTSVGPNCVGVFTDPNQCMYTPCPP